MTNEGSSLAQRTADRLALALEDAGFDVGQEFPELHGTMDRSGSPVVDLGRVTSAVASRLTDVLALAVSQDHPRPEV